MKTCVGWPAPTSPVLLGLVMLGRVAQYLEFNFTALGLATVDCIKFAEFKFCQTRWVSTSVSQRLAGSEIPTV
jgi:hypothetical protein